MTAQPDQSSEEWSFDGLGDGWSGVLRSTRVAMALGDAAAYVARRRRDGTVLPTRERVLAAMAATPLDAVRAVILGQDPYPNPAHAVGLAFSVPADFVGPLPRSLQNVRQELHEDRGTRLPGHGSLEAWARHGVLLLNTALTVSVDAPRGHDVWGLVTDEIIKAVADRPWPVAFLLWGNHAKGKVGLIDERRHVVIRSAHPSPLSSRGFLGSRPFSRADDGLVALGAEPIDWRLELLQPSSSSWLARRL